MNASDESGRYKRPTTFHFDSNDRQVELKNAHLWVIILRTVYFYAFGPSTLDRTRQKTGSEYLTIFLQRLQKYLRKLDSTVGAMIDPIVRASLHELCSSPSCSIPSTWPVSCAITKAELKPSSLHNVWESAGLHMPWTGANLKIIGMNRIFGILNRQKSVRMTEIEKSKLRNLIKVGYFLSFRKFLELNSNIGFHLY